MKRIKRMTLVDLMLRLRESGLGLGFESLKEALNNGFMAGIVFNCTIPGGDANYIILENEVNAWIEAHSVDEQPCEEFLEFAKQLEQVSA